MSGNDCRNINVTIAVISEGSRRWLNPHIEEFQRINPHVKINLVLSETQSHSDYLQDILDDHAENGDLFGFDGYEALAGFIADYVQSFAAVDLTQRIRIDSEVSQQWINILPFYRQGNGVFDKKVYMLPADDNGYFMFYRRDLFDTFNVTVPRTWDELQYAIEFFHGLEDDVTNMTYHGLCLNRRNGCGSGSCFHMSLGTISQTLGTTQGSFVDPSTGELIPKEAMMKAVEIIDRTVPYSDPDDFLEGTVPSREQCLSIKFTSSQCAITYGTFNLVQDTVKKLFDDLEMGVAPLPASDIVMDRVTGKLSNCSSRLCPFGIQIPVDNEKQTMTVNYAPFYGTIGRVFGLSTWTSAEKQDIIIKFVTHVIANSNNDAIPDLNGRFGVVHPYQLSHLNETKWLEKNHSIEYVRPLLDSFEKSSSENANILPRVGDKLTSFNRWLHRELSEYLTETAIIGNDGIDERRNVFVDKVREQLTTQVLNDGTFLESYQKSLGIYQEPATERFIPDSLFITCIVCGCVVLCLALRYALYLQKNKSDEVVSAFYPNLLLGNCIGSCAIAIAIMVLPFDEERVGMDLSSYACRIEPSLFILGNSIFLCSTLADIVFTIESSRKRASGMLKRSENVNISHLMKSSILTMVPAFVGVILFLIDDEPKWDRDTYIEDGEVWGMCSATLSSSLSLKFVSYWFLVLVAFCLLILPFSKYNEVQRPWILLTLSIYMQAMVCCFPILNAVEGRPLAFLTTRLLFYIIIAVISYGFFVIPMTLRRDKTSKRITESAKMLVTEDKKLSESRDQLYEIDKKTLKLLNAHPELTGKVLSRRDKHMLSRRFAKKYSIVE